MKELKSLPTRYACQSLQHYIPMGTIEKLLASLGVGDSCSRSPGNGTPSPTACHSVGLQHWHDEHTVFLHSPARAWCFLSLVKRSMKNCEHAQYLSINANMLNRHPGGGIGNFLFSVCRGGPYLSGSNIEQMTYSKSFRSIDTISTSHLLIQYEDYLY